MIKEGYVKVNRYYEDYLNHPDDFQDLKDEEIYYQQATRQYYVKFHCSECDAQIWLCYPKSHMNWLLHELEEGGLCEDCANADPESEDGLIGAVCSCNR